MPRPVSRRQALETTGAAGAGLPLAPITFCGQTGPIGAFMKMAMAWDNAARQFTVRLAPGSRVRPPLTRQIIVRVAGEKTPARLAFNGAPAGVRL